MINQHRHFPFPYPDLQPLQHNGQTLQPIKSNQQSQQSVTLETETCDLEQDMAQSILSGRSSISSMQSILSERRSISSSYEKKNVSFNNLHPMNLVE